MSGSRHARCSRRVVSLPAPEAAVLAKPGTCISWRIPSLLRRRPLVLHLALHRPGRWSPSPPSRQPRSRPCARWHALPRTTLPSALRPPCFTNNLTSQTHHLSLRLPSPSSRTSPNLKHRPTCARDCLCLSCTSNPPASPSQRHPETLLSTSLPLATTPCDRKTMRREAAGSPPTTGMLPSRPAGQRRACQDAKRPSSQQPARPKISRLRKASLLNGAALLHPPPLHCGAWPYQTWRDVEIAGVVKRNDEAKRWRAYDLPLYPVLATRRVGLRNPKISDGNCKSPDSGSHHGLYRSISSRSCSFLLPPPYPTSSFSNSSHTHS